MADAQKNRPLGTNRCVNVPSRSTRLTVDTLSQHWNLTQTVSSTAGLRNTWFPTLPFSSPSTLGLVPASVNSLPIMRPLRSSPRSRSRSNPLHWTWTRTRKPSHQPHGRRQTAEKRSKRFGSSHILRSTPRVGFGLRWKSLMSNDGSRRKIGNERTGTVSPALRTFIFL